MPREKADLAWYSAESRKQKLTPRCPIACAELCPRYFESVALLGEVGGWAKIPSEQFASLERKWKAFQSAMPEDLPSVCQERGRTDTVSQFCPEVSYDRFGYFASDLLGYTDEIDRNSDKEDYKRKGIFEQFDFNWERVRPAHYTECREYSIHGAFAAGKPSRIPPERGAVSPKRRWQVLARDSFTCVYCGRKPPDVTLHVDHKVSVKDGGRDDLDNLVTACSECNGGKSDSSL